MSVRLIETLHTRARWTVALLVALVVGVVGGTWAAASSQLPTVIVTTVADATTPDAQETGRPDKTAKAEKSAKAIKPAKADKPARTGVHVQGAQGVHGACVSAIARDESLVGGPHANHGGAVSAAAHSCPRGNAGHARGQSADAPGQDELP